MFKELDRDPGCHSHSIQNSSNFFLNLFGKRVGKIPKIGPEEYQFSLLFHLAKLTNNGTFAIVEVSFVVKLSKMQKGF
jgi:hypothetical protein